MNVLIAGGGIAGPALALFLQRVGIASTVFEARDDADEAGGGLSVAPNGMNVLDALGLADAAQSMGTVALVNCFRSEGGRTLARYDNGSHGYGRQAVNLRRADLRRLLRDELRRIGCALVEGNQITKVVASEECVTITLENGRTAVGDVLVGADGIHSRVRAQVFADATEPQYVGIVAFGGFVPRPETASPHGSSLNALNFTFGRQGMFGYGGARPGELMWWCNTWRDEPLSAGEIARGRANRLAPALLPLFREYHEPIPTILATSTPALAINVYDMPSLPVWHRGRVVLIGDAAHAVSPNSGQGAALALEDAQYLARTLTAAGSDYSRAFSEFERHRRDRVERIAREGRRRARDKRQMSAFRSEIRNAILMVALRLFGERSHDWVYRYRVDTGSHAP